jgi:Apolipoprotein N-acyltransferase
MLKFFNRRFFILFIFPLFLGSITVLGFNPFNLLFVNAFSMSMLFYLVFYVKKKTQSSYRKKPFLKNLFFLGTSYGFGFFLFGLYWITYSLTFDPSFKFLIPFALIFIPLFLSLFFSLPIILIGRFVEFKISSIILISILFSISDFLRSFILTGFPWNLWAYSLSWSQESLQILN